MYGAIIGDLSGSIYEFSQVKEVFSVKMNKLIEDNAFYSDDTILTMAILDAIQNNGSYEEFLKYYINYFSNYRPDFRPYFRHPFSPGMMKWAKGNYQGNSTGNGAMMRISPVGYLFDLEEEVIKNAKLATIPSHNSVEAVDSATIIALIIFYARKGYSKEEIFKKLNLPIIYEPFKKFNSTCSETINNCLYALYISDNFNDSIKNALLMGGDTDTNACIVGSMAEALYGIDESIKKLAEEKLPREFIKILRK